MAHLTPPRSALLTALLLTACGDSGDALVSTPPSDASVVVIPHQEFGDDTFPDASSAPAPDVPAPCAAAEAGPSDEEVAALISADFATLDAAAKPQTLYLSLAHLSEGASACDVDHYRYGAGQLMNMLSRASGIVPTTFIDAQKTIARFDVRDLRWTPDTLPYVMTMGKEQRYGVLRNVPLGAAAVRLDWASEQLTRPELYSYIMDNQLLERMIEAQAGVDFTKPGQFGGVYKSVVAKNPRFLERRESEHGACWISHDFLYRTQGVTAMETGVLPPDDVRFGLQVYIAREYICTLPNGLHHYDLTGFVSQRRWDVPTCAAHNEARADEYVLTGQCYNCHADGLIAFQDQVRGGKANPSSWITERFPVQSELDALFAKDQARYRAAVEQIDYYDPKYGVALNDLNKLYKQRSGDDGWWHSGGTFGAFLPKGGTAGPLWEDVIVPIQDLAVDLGILLPVGILIEDIPSKVLPEFQKKYEEAGLTDETCYDF
jgi:hypothetical protein